MREVVVQEEGYCGRPGNTGHHDLERALFIVLVVPGRATRDEPERMQKGDLSYEEMAEAERQKEFDKIASYLAKDVKSNSRLMLSKDFQNLMKDCRFTREAWVFLPVIFARRRAIWGCLWLAWDSCIPRGYFQQRISAEGWQEEILTLRAQLFKHLWLPLVNHRNTVISHLYFFDRMRQLHHTFILLILLEQSISWPRHKIRQPARDA
jgi:hypothetical protein